MEFDLHSNIDDRMALNPTAINSNTTTVGNIIDSLGYESLEFVVSMGTIVDGVYALVLEEGDDAALADAAVVPADNVLGALTGFVAADDNSTKRVGSIGKKRYQRLSIVSTGVTTGVDHAAATAVLGHPKTAPVAQ